MIMANGSTGGAKLHAPGRLGPQTSTPAALASPVEAPYTCGDVPSAFGQYAVFQPPLAESRA